MQDLLTLLQTGKYLPAVALVLIALVGAARAGLGAHWPWFKTKIGGYFLGYGSATVLYVATAWQAGEGVTIALLASALAAGWTASGGWEHARDILAALQSKPPTDGAEKPAELPRAVAVGGALSTLALIALLVGCSGCGPSGKITSNETANALIDCTIDASAGTISTERDALIATALGGGSWSKAGDRARDDAKAIGVNAVGCALAQAVQFFNGGRKAVSVDASNSANDALEDFRATMTGGATFHTASGDL